MWTYDVVGKPFLYDVVDKQFFSNTTECLDEVMHCKQVELLSTQRAALENHIWIHRSGMVDLIPGNNI
jgi:hypothetical protein